MSSRSHQKSKRQGSTRTTTVIVMALIAIGLIVVYYSSDRDTSTHQTPPPVTVAGSHTAHQSAANAPIAREEEVAEPAKEGELLELREADFQREVLDAKLPVLMDFWAPWCAPCRMVEPTLKSLAKRYAGKVKIVRVNVDDNPGLARRYNIEAIPTLIIIEDGEIAHRSLGVQPEEKIAAAIDEALAE